MLHSRIHFGLACVCEFDLFSLTDKKNVLCIGYIGAPFTRAHIRWLRFGVIVVTVLYFSLSFFSFTSFAKLCWVRALLWSNGPVRRISRKVLLASVTSISKRRKTKAITRRYTAEKIRHQYFAREKSFLQIFCWINKQF